jgi:AraC-like DNA-binding protein
MWNALIIAIATARERRAREHSTRSVVERVDLFHEYSWHRLADDRFDLCDSQFAHRKPAWFQMALTALRSQVRMFSNPDMAPEGWTVRGELRNPSDPSAASDFEASLASRFVIEARGRWKTAVARPANAVGMRMEAGGIESDFHSHRESQLMFQVRGELTCDASNALWIVPPQSALWIPGGVSHRIRPRAPLEGYSVFVRPRAGAKLPRECCAVSVSALFRELLFRITLAIQRMSRGASVQQVALSLGYTSSSSFVTMFRKTLGTSPARYMAHRLIAQ